MGRNLVVLLLLATLAGCATALQPEARLVLPTFPAEAQITQRGIFTALGRQFSLNGYLSQSPQGGRRLVVTENFGHVLVDVLVQPDGAIHIMRYSKPFRPKWIERYVVGDLQYIFGGKIDPGCHVQQLGQNHFLLKRRWYKLDLQIVEVKPGPQPARMFQINPEIHS